MLKKFLNKISSILFIISLGFILAFSANVQAKKPNIVILATGGTIAGAAKSKTATVGYQSGVFKVQDLINAVPGLSDIANVSGEQIANIDSQDMNATIWLQLTNRINDLLKSDKVDGIVITHGTDTLEETAYFLNLTIKSKKTVVVVGSMRPATAISADGPLNLYNAVKIAGSNSAKGRGVLVAMNDTIFTARDVTKGNTFKVDTFIAPNNGPIGYIQSGNIYFSTKSTKKHTFESILSAPSDAAELPKVVIIYNYAGITKDYVEALAKLNVKGIVVAGVGDGGLGTVLKESLGELAKKGIVIVRSSRVGSGIVARNGEANDDTYGFVVADDLNPQKARILLQLALLKTADVKQIQSIFYQH